MWGAIKAALNSTLGRPNFTQLDKVVYNNLYDLWYNALYANSLMSGSNAVAFNTGLYIDIGKFESFENNSNLKMIICRRGPTRVASNAFYNCENLDTVIIPEGVTEIGDEAFTDDFALSYVYLPSTLKKLGSMGDTNTNASWEYNGTKAEWAEIEKGYGWGDMDSYHGTIYCLDGVISTGE